MPARSSCGVVRVVYIVVGLVGLVGLGSAACSAGDTSVDPGDLELRDVLGISPDIAADWSAAQRIAARRVLDGALRSDDTTAWQGTVAGDIDTLDLRVAQLLATGDA